MACRSGWVLCRDFQKIKETFACGGFTRCDARHGIRLSPRGVAVSELPGFLLPRCNDKDSTAEGGARHVEIVSWVKKTKQHATWQPSRTYPRTRLATLSCSELGLPLNPYPPNVQQRTNETLRLTATPSLSWPASSLFTRLYP